jgi:hypothetical protein
MPDDAIGQIRQVFGLARLDPSTEVRVVQESFIEVGARWKTVRF